jgi:hypothetical protein
MIALLEQKVLEGQVLDSTTLRRRRDGSTLFYALLQCIGYFPPDLTFLKIRVKV